MANTTTSTNANSSSQIDLMIKEDTQVLRSIIENTPDEEKTYTNDVPKEKLFQVLGSKVGKVYKDLMMKLNILKMDLYSFHTAFQDFLKRDKKYKDANDLDKLNIKASITNLKNWIGTVEDFKSNLK